MNIKTICTYAAIGLFLAAVFGLIPIGFSLKIGKTQININTLKR